MSAACRRLDSFEPVADGDGRVTQLRRMARILLASLSSTTRMGPDSEIRSGTCRCLNRCFPVTGSFVGMLGQALKLTSSSGRRERDDSDGGD